MKIIHLNWFKFVPIYNANYPEFKGDWSQILLILKTDYLCEERGFNYDELISTLEFSDDNLFIKFCLIYSYAIISIENSLD